MSELKVISSSPSVQTYVSKNIVPQKKIKESAENKDNTAQKVILSGLAAAAAIGAAVFALKSGKVQNIAKEISVEKFKEAGNKFVNGKAITKSGKPFTGTIIKINKNGEKRTLEYVDGYMKEVNVFKPDKRIEKCTYEEYKELLKKGEKVYFNPEAGYAKEVFTGDYTKLELKTKNYNYDEAGKLISVDVRPADTDITRVVLDGPPVVKTINLKEKAQKGVDAYKAKQAAIQKQKEINTYVEEIRQQLSGKQKINAKTIDSSFGNYKPLKERSDSYDRLVHKYEYLEEKEQKIKENVSKLKEKMHTKSEINNQTIDDNLFPKNKELEELNSFYKDLETKSIEKAERKAYLKAHPEEAKALRKAQKAERLNARTTQEQFYSEEFGQDVVSVTVKGKNGTQVTKIYTRDKETLLREIFVNNNQTTRVTGIKASSVDSQIAVTEHVDNMGYITKVTKQKVKEPNGKYVDVIRTKHSERAYPVQTSDGFYEILCSEKNVYKLNNGKSMTEYVGKDGDKIQILRDKKGKILEEIYIGPDKTSGPDELKIKLLEQWYINYLNLCKKYNMRPLSGEAGSGAFSHFRDLLLRDTDYIEFLSLLNTLKYRAQYNSDAAVRLMLLDGLRFEAYEIEKILRGVLEKKGIDALEKYVEKLCFRLPDYEEKIINIFQNLQQEIARSKARNPIYVMA